MIAEQHVRTIDSGTAPSRYARGWHCLGLLKDFTDGAPHAVSAFGTKLVVFASADGAVHVLDGYCRHMGGDLTQGTVKGDEIACPFHDWRWGGDGRCKSIPYAKRVPLRARTRSWRTAVQNDQLFVWHDAQGTTPGPELDIPAIDGDVAGPEWSNWTWDSVVIEGSNCREIVDNVVDMPHFFYIHFGLPTYFKNVFDGHIASQYLDTKGRNDVTDLGLSGGDDVLLKSEAHYFGPSYMINYLHNDYHGLKIENVLINCHYPITQDSFRLMWGVKVKKLPGLDDSKADHVAAKFAKNVGLGFLQDVEIWRNKTRIDNPLLCEEDGPVYQLRRWYEQFYVDVDDVTDDMTQRFEFEVDTTHALAAWEAEVAENIARQASSSSSVSADSRADAEPARGPGA
ncbi:Rieske 2Fe-2S domain-containing protein [Tsukamurella sp. 8F]|uniref:Rieske 2Fe-2S domain-containing protein n=1 Tax=unclassified Tsukamurella TaxID=2633480 RepID=UPI0023B8B440|nr:MULTISPECIES: Rieske 2Fe-2S domain-containing protein [unclassified Tsukamurella]MDF0530710.1 Rieske 2Fe-2S domain-containing protein [Tsukamurella sp. 8J]MDF0587911.1 Rieske 2Fe-2S domain-containing protein [Tsukamurella sp. 8F]